MGVTVLFVCQRGVGLPACFWPFGASAPALWFAFGGQLVVVFSISLFALLGAPGVAGVCLFAGREKG